MREKVLISFGRGRGIGDLTLVGRAHAVFAQETEKALAICPARTPTAVDSRSG